MLRLFFLHCPHLRVKEALLSLLAVGGAITTAPDMQRYLVVERGWLDQGVSRIVDAFLSIPVLIFGVSAASAAMTADAPLVALGYRETSLVFMTDTRTRVFGADQAPAAADAAQAGGAALVSCVAPPKLPWVSSFV